jgi:electron transfer flavoprotein alpha subunit
MGKLVAPRLAYRLGVGIAQDCIDVTHDHKTGRVTVTRPVYGGNAIAKFKFSNNDPQIIVIRENIFEPLSQDINRTGEVTNLPSGLENFEPKSRFIETIKKPKEGIQMEDASVVVGGGRGLGGPEPFKQLEDLAHLFGGAVGASRAVCDAGWMDHSYQIGLTGKTVSPDLYITIGISGASQHMAGCSASKTIVAINKDPDANIFKTADYGVVGNWEQILPAFTEAVRDLLNG